MFLKGQEITSAEVFAAAQEGDAYAKAIVQETVMYLAIGILTACRFFDPDFVLIGGGVINAGDELLLTPLREEIKKMTWRVLPHPQEIKFASLGGDSGSVGAAAVAIGIGE